MQSRSWPLTCLPLLISIVALPQVTDPTLAYDFVWTGEYSNRWSDWQNWNPYEFGPPTTSDTVRIGNDDNVLIDADFTSANFVNGLTISGGSRLYTNGFEAVVDNSAAGLSALTLVTGLDSTLIITEHNSGVAHDSFDTDLLTIQERALVRLVDGRLEVDSGPLHVGSDSVLSGYGNIDLEASVGAVTTLLKNEGLLRSGQISATVPTHRILSINVSDADGRIDLDGDSGKGEVLVGSRSTLDINGRLRDSFSDRMRFGYDSRLEMAYAWTADANSTIDVDAKSLQAGVASTATIYGRTMTHAGVINVHSGTFYVEPDFLGSSGTIKVGGHGEAAAISFRGASAVLGALHLNGTQAAPASINGDTIQIVSGTRLVVTGYGRASGQFQEWRSNFGAGSSIHVNGRGITSSFEIDGYALVEGNLRLDGNASLAANRIELASGSTTTVDGVGYFLPDDPRFPVIGGGHIILGGGVPDPRIAFQSGGDLDARITGTIEVASAAGRMSGRLLFDGATVSGSTGSRLTFADSVELRNTVVSGGLDLQFEGPMSISGSNNLALRSLTISNDWRIADNQAISASNVSILKTARLLVDPNRTLTLEAEEVYSDGVFTCGSGGKIIIRPVNPTPLVLSGEIALGGGGATIGGHDLETQGNVTGNGQVFTEMSPAPLRWTNAGRVLPGFSPGVIQVNGDYEQTDTAELLIELGGISSETEYDVLSVAGTAELDGSLIVDLIDTGSGLFVPTLGDEFDIVTAAGGFNGTRFATLDLPDLDAGLKWNVSYSHQAVTLQVGLAGDINHDGNRNGADLLDWQRGRSTNLQSRADLAEWEANYGVAASSSVLVSTVPEPTTICMAIISLMSIALKGERS